MHGHAASPSIGGSGGQLCAYGKGSSVLDSLLIHDARSHDPPYNHLSHSNGVTLYHASRWSLA